MLSVWGWWLRGCGGREGEGLLAEVSRAGPGRERSERDEFGVWGCPEMVEWKCLSA